MLPPSPPLPSESELPPWSKYKSSVKKTGSNDKSANPRIGEFRLMPFHNIWVWVAAVPLKLAVAEEPCPYDFIKTGEKPEISSERSAVTDDAMAKESGRVIFNPASSIF